MIQYNDGECTCVANYLNSHIIFIVLKLIIIHECAPDKILSMFVYSSLVCVQISDSCEIQLSLGIIK